MSLIHYLTREIRCKIVYYGPGLGGKTTNLRIIHDRAPDEAKGRMVSIATESDRTLFFDFLPLDIGAVRGFKVRLHLYTVPGQNLYAASRRLVLRGADGVVFVADSQSTRLRDNEESLADLDDNLRQMGENSSGRIPLVIQYNKRDLADTLPIQELEAALNPHGVVAFEAVAMHGVGVFETLRACCKEVLRGLEERRPEVQQAGGS